MWDGWRWRGVGGLGTSSGEGGCTGEGEGGSLDDEVTSALYGRDGGRGVCLPWDA